MAVTSACACCGNPTPGPLEWSWCAECNRAGCIRLRSDAEGGDVRRGRECPLLKRRETGQARTITVRGMPAPMRVPADRPEFCPGCLNDVQACMCDTVVVDVDEGCR